MFIILNIIIVIQRSDFVKELIKKIRTFLNLSQTELATLLNISFATVNRWENGRAVPNKLAQSTLYELCKINNVPVYDMVIDKIKVATEAIKTDESRVLLYHGSKSGIKGNVEPKSRTKCDFGKGFYMGTEPSQSLTLICDYEKSKLYIVSIAVDELEILDVPVDLEWAMIVAYHRGRMDKIKGTAFYNKYHDMTNNKDMIVGSIADDRMFYVIDNFFLGNITDAALVNSLSALELGKQYVAITQKACNAVKIECEVELSYLERQFLKDIAGVNRTNGISLANKICKDYRREGKFFDELLDNALKEV